MLIVRSGCERFNQEFFKNCTPKDDIPDQKFLYDFKGYHGCYSRCKIEILPIRSGDDGYLVIATDDDSAKGTSITNIAEHLATRICYEYKIPPEKLRWVEHYARSDVVRSDGKNVHEWDYVRFDIVIGDDEIPRLLHPKWIPLTDKFDMEREIEGFRMAAHANNFLDEYINKLRKGEQCQK